MNRLVITCLGFKTYFEGEISDHALRELRGVFNFYDVRPYEHAGTTYVEMRSVTDAQVITLTARLYT